MLLLMIIDLLHLRKCTNKVICIVLKIKHEIQSGGLYSN